MKNRVHVMSVVAFLSSAALAQTASQSEALQEGQGSYEARLKALREQVEQLKGRAFDAKTRLMLLGEQVLSNLIADARAVIVHKNDASSLLTLEEVVYFLDNQKIYYQSNRDGGLDANREFVVFEGSLSPGHHVLSVEMVYRGNGKVFTYLSGYVFQVKSAFSFYAAKGYETRVQAVGYEKGGLTAPLEDRPSVRFEMQRHKVASEAESGEAIPDSGRQSQ